MFSGCCGNDSGVKPSGSSAITHARRRPTSPMTPTTSTMPVMMTSVMCAPMVGTSTNGVRNEPRMLPTVESA